MLAVALAALSLAGTPDVTKLVLSPSQVASGDTIAVRVAEGTFGAAVE